ncbi:MAG TPA: Dabb family protein [Burkholderiales bacterium]|nr:Dabb family protein [Burkholderiales bacterium]
MISHVVLFNLKQGIDPNDERVAEVVAGMQALPAQIDFIRGWEHGFNRTADAQAWSYGLRALFDNEGDLYDYFGHPDHVVVLKQWEEIADLAFCDYEI